MKPDRDQRPDDSRAGFGSMFPMPMTSMEKFHWFDNSEEYPNLIFGRLRFDQAVDPQLAQQAWELAIGRHPFSRVRPNRQTRWVWQSCADDRISDGQSFRHCNLDSAPSHWDMTTDPADQSGSLGLTLLRWPAPEIPATPIEPEMRFHCEARFHVHHAIADGVGSVQVINEWLTIYNNLVHGIPPLTGLHRIDLDRLAQRNRLGLTTWRYLRHLPKQPVALFGAAKFMFRKTATLELPAGADSRPGNRGYPAMVGRWLSNETTSAVYDRAADSGVSANSVLLGELFATLHHWRTRSGQTKTGDRDWIRVILPVNIRSHADRRLPATNRTSIVQLDRREPDPNDMPSFYRMLNREVQIIRNWQLDKMFLIFIRGISVSERSLKRAAANPTSRGLAVFTDLGRPFQSAVKRLARQDRSNALTTGSGPGLLPVDFDLVGPIRAGTPVNLSVSRFGGRLKISIHYDGRFLTQVQAEALISQYESQLMRLRAKPRV